MAEGRGRIVLDGTRNLAAITPLQLIPIPSVQARVSFLGAKRKAEQSNLTADFGVVAC